MALNRILKGKSKRKANAANERKFRIFSEAVWRWWIASHSFGGESSAAPVVPGRRRFSPPSPDARLGSAELLGLETTSASLTPTPGFSNPRFQSSFLWTRRQGGSRGQQYSPVSSVCSSRSDQLPAWIGKDPSPHLPLQNPRVSMVPS